MEARNSVAHNTIFINEPPFASFSCSCSDAVPSESMGLTRDSARYKEHATRMMSMHATPSGRDQEGAHSAAIEISRRHRIKTKSVARDPAGVRTKKMSIFARVKIGASSADCRS